MTVWQKAHPAAVVYGCVLGRRDGENIPSIEEFVADEFGSNDPGRVVVRLSVGKRKVDRLVARVLRVQQYVEQAALTQAVNLWHAGDRVADLSV